MRNNTSIMPLTCGAAYRTYNETEIEFWKKNYYLIWNLHEVLTGNYAAVINEKIWDLMYLLIKICYIHDTNVPNLLSAAVPNFCFCPQIPHLESSYYHRSEGQFLCSEYFVPTRGFRWGKKGRALRISQRVQTFYLFLSDIWHPPSLTPFLKRLVQWWPWICRPTFLLVQIPSAPPIYVHIYISLKKRCVTVSLY